MSEEVKKERGIPEIQQDYQNGACKAGHLQYQIFTLQKDLDLVNETLRELNFEAAALQAKSNAEAKPAEGAAK